MTEPAADHHRSAHTVLLVDDQRIMLTALRAYLDEAADLIVVGEAQDGRSAIVQARALRPDAIVMDLQMPAMDGIEATTRILQERPDTAILAVTTFHSEEYAIPALRAGARGYLLKSEEPEVILDGIRATIRGESVVSHQIAALLISSLASQPPAAQDPEIAHRAESLTPRERDVLRVLCQGRSNRQISRELALSETTVKTHISSIMTKLGARDRLHAVVLAFTFRLLDQH